MHTYDEIPVIHSYTVDDAIDDGTIIDVTACPAAGPEAEPDPVRPLSSIDSMTEYLRSYGKILGRKAVSSLKPLHVPSRDPLPDFEDVLREPFPCQQHVVAAGVELLNTVGSGFICGEMGTGKTLLGMLAAFKHAQQPRSKGGRGGKFRCLVLCPDHLIAKWKREIEETIPGAKTYHFGSLSKEDAKARKKEDGKTGQRPAINDLINLLDKRAGNRWAKPNGPEYYVIGRDQIKWLPDWLGISDPYKGMNAVGGLLGGRRFVRKIGQHPDGTPITQVANEFGAGSGQPATGLSSRNVVVEKIPMTDANGNPILDASGRQKQKSVTVRAFCCPKCGNVIRDGKGVPMSAQAISKNQMTCSGKYLQQVLGPDRPKTEHGLDKIAPMPASYADRTSGHLNIGANRYEVKTCGEPLWWYTSAKFRYPLARIIQRKFRRFFDYLIVDECHEQQSDEAAQSMAAGKLIGSVPHVLALTGTLIGGYAMNLFALVMRINPRTLREEGFEWGKHMDFSKVYGKIDRVVTTKEESGIGVGAGKGQASMRRAKTGQSKEKSYVRPGIMPTLFGRHMIGNTVFIALDEMAEGLPDMFEYIGGACPPPPETTGDDDQDAAERDRYERMKAFWVDTACPMEEEQEAEYNRIESTLEFAAKELLKRGSMKLLGTLLATTMGWPDYCHAEWAMDDEVIKGMRRQSEEQDGLDEKIANLHTVGYWEKPGSKDIKNWCGVVTPKPVGADMVYPKEQALVDICKKHKAAGHQVWVYCQMTGKRNVMPRLRDILKREGLQVGIMRSEDVPPKEREAWIAEHGREYDVMICFPKLVSTGLDLFSKAAGGHNFNCIVFYETGYKLNEMRQAARRAWRIGQPRDCYIYYLYYQGTMQHRAMSLMSKKMAAALALEGEFSEEGLAALSGEGDEQMALAKSMSEKIDDADMQRSWQKVKSQADKKKPAKKRAPVEAIADLAKGEPTSPLDEIEEAAQLLARTVLDRQAKAVPLAAKDDIIALAERFAQADAGMWATARRMADDAAYDAELWGTSEPVEPEPEKVEQELNREQDAADSGLGYDELSPMIEHADVPASEAASESEPRSGRPTLKVHRPEAEPVRKVHAVFDDIEFDDELIAKMMANMASHGMSASDIFC